MLKSTFVLLVVLIASAASRSSKQSDQRLHLERRLDEVSTDTNAMLDAMLEQVQTRTKELENVASAEIETMSDEIKKEVRSAIDQRKKSQMTDDGTKCSNLVLELEKLEKKWIESAKKCTEKKLSEHKPESSAQRKVAEVKKTLKEAKEKLSNCDNGSGWIKCVSGITQEIIPISSSLTNWNTENLQNKDKILKDFTSSLEICRSKKIRDNFAKEMNNVINDHQGC